MQRAFGVRHLSLCVMDSCGWMLAEVELLALIVLFPSDSFSLRLRQPFFFALLDAATSSEEHAISHLGDRASIQFSGEFVVS